MTKSLDLKRDDPRSHPFDTTAPSISRRALDHADLLSGDYWGELRTFLWVAKAGSLSKAAELLGSSHATVGREIRRLQDQMGSQLVVLTKNGAQLTQKGHALTDELLRLDQRLFSIASDLRAEKAEAEGAGSGSPTGSVSASWYRSCGVSRRNIQKFRCISRVPATSRTFGRIRQM